ncbi:MAG: DUF3971 domain-containing protein [Proteobacteria bacterium]|nr:DUF3971 domain-containing protein [Pseudomonadota bacterium]
MLEQLSNAVGYEIHANQIELIFWQGIGVSARNFEVRSPQGPEKFTASRISVNLSLRALIRGDIVPTGLTLVQPEIELALEKGWWLSKSDGGSFLEETPLKALAGFPSVTLEKALVHVKGMPLKVKDLFLHLSRRRKAPVKHDITLKGKIVYMREEVPFSVRGSIVSDERRGTSAEMRLWADKIPISCISWPDAVPVQKGVAGIEMNANRSFDGNLSAKGTITAKNLEFMIIDDGDKKSFSFANLSLPFNASYAGSMLEIPFFQMKGAGFTLDVSSTLDLKDRSNPHLNLNVKSPAMPLETFRRIFPSSLLPQWVDTRLFPIFSGGDVRVDLFSLNGKLNQIKDLDIQKNAGALLLRLTCSGLTAFKDGGGVPVEEVSGNLKIEKGGIHVSGARGRFRDSRIGDGTLHLSSLYVDDPIIRVTVDGSFDLEDLFQQKDLPLIPDEVRQQLQEIESPTGKMDANIQVGYEGNWEYPKILKGKFKFKNCAITGRNLLFPVFVEDGDLIIEEEKNKKFVATGQWGKSKIYASGEIGESWKTGSAHIAAQADMDELIGHLYPDLQSFIWFRNQVPCRLSLTKKKRNWDFIGEMDLKNASLETASMTVDPFGDKGEIIFNGRVQPGKEFSLTNLKCNLGESSFRLAGTYDLRNRDLFDFRVSSKKVLLEDLGVRFRKGNLRGSGALEFDATVKGSRSKPMMTGVTGEARARNLFFAARAFPHPVENCNFGLKFTGRDLSIDFLDLKLGKSPFHVKGLLQGWDGIRGTLTIKSDDLDLSDLIPPKIFAGFKGETPDPPGFAGSKGDQTPTRRGEGAKRFVEKSDIQLNISAPNGQWEGFRYGPLRVECALRSGDLYISRSSVKSEHGELRLIGHVKRGKKPEMLFSSYVNVIKQPLNELPRSLERIKSRAEGMLTMEALVYAKGSNKDDLISSLTGSVNVLIEQGVLKKSHVFIKIMNFLSLQRIFEERPSGLSKEGLYFESIGGHIDINEGLVTGENITMQSPVFNAVAMGEANLFTERVNAELGIQPLVTIDSLVSKIPIAGYLLTGDKKALYVDYFKVEGPLSDPDVRYIPLKSIGNGTVGFFKRLFLSPHRLFKSISDAARDFEGKGLPLPDEYLKPENDMGA